MKSQIKLAPSLLWMLDWTVVDTENMIFLGTNLLENGLIYLLVFAEHGVVSEVGGTWHEIPGQ